MTRELVTVDLSDAWPERFESLPPVRVPRAFKGQRNFAGSWWFATTQIHVGFESWLERDHLMLLDFAPEVVAVAAQPFTAVLPTSAGSRKHTPDYFVRMADGTGVVVDVRPDARVAKDAEVFDATAVACARVGWDYRRLGDITPMLAANVRWLSGYRHPRCRTNGVADALQKMPNTPVAAGRIAESMDVAENLKFARNLMQLGVVNAIDRPSS